MRIIARLLFASFVFFTSIAHSHTGATGIVKERMDAMKEMKDSSRLVRDMFKGESDFSRTAVDEVADLFLQHGQSMLSLFPDTEKSRKGKKTEALPEIWEQWDDFSDEVDKFIRASEALKQVVVAEGSQRSLNSAFNKTLDSCKSCHKPFRKAKKK